MCSFVGFDRFKVCHMAHDGIFAQNTVCAVNVAGNTSYFKRHPDVIAFCHGDVLRRQLVLVLQAAHAQREELPARDRRRHVAGRGLGEAKLQRDVGRVRAVVEREHQGAAGAVEAIFSILAIRDQVAPPTLNLDNPAFETPIDLVPHAARKREIRAALSNSFGFGGTNASLIFVGPPN